MTSPEKMSLYKSADWLLVAVMLTFFTLLPTLQNGWVNWDDGTYVLENELVTKFSPEKIPEIFGTLEVAGNYHPLTITSLGIDHSIGGARPFVYHLQNLLWHLLNVSMVFWFILLLSKKPRVAFLVALLFGVHPMHVESVAWVSERKDVLYAFFYLAGLVSYLYYLESSKHKARYAFLCLLLFIAALLSKAAAVTFPLVLVLIDRLKGRTRWKQLIREKTIFFALSLLFIIVGIMAARSGNSFNNTVEIPWYQSPFVASYNLMVYLVKLVFPFQLSAFHPFPMQTAGNMPWYMYLSIAPIGLIGWTVFQFRKKHPELLFGCLFFLISLLPMLQFLQIGRAMYAERYTYVAYIGLFYILSLAFDTVLTNPETKKSSRLALNTMCGIFLLFFILKSHDRTLVWRNGRTLWTDVAWKYPEHALGFGNRGNYSVSIDEDNAAFLDFDYSVTLNPDFSDGYNNRGRIHQSRRNLDFAFEDFNRAIQSDSTNYIAWMNRSLLNLQFNQPVLALYDINKAAAISPEDARIVYNRSLIYYRLNKKKLALMDAWDAKRLGFPVPAEYLERLRLEE